MILVELETWEYEWASHVGARRYIENWGKKDAPYYDKKRMEDDRTAQVAACVGELAVAKITNQYWSGHVWHQSVHKEYKHIPDVGNDIEVRRVRTSTSAAVAPEFRAVEILGWIDHDEAWEKGEPSGYSEDTRVIAEEHLHPAMNYTRGDGKT